MELFIDSANLNWIKKLVASYPIDGVTTNPTILSREKHQDFYSQLQEIYQIIGPERKLFVQTTGKNADEIVREAEILSQRFKSSLVLKIPMSEEGLRAIPLVKKAGISCAMTAVFSPMQALLAAQAGADYVALFVNRLDNILADGPDVIAQTLELFENQGMNTKVLAASFKTAEQGYRCLLSGVKAITIPAEIYPVLASHPLTDKAIVSFDNDWSGMYGEQKILDF